MEYLGYRRKLPLEMVQTRPRDRRTSNWTKGLVYTALCLCLLVVYGVPFTRPSWLAGVVGLSAKGLYMIRPIKQSERLLSGDIGTVEWFDCGFKTDPGVECGRIIVPKDYFDSSAGTSTIALGRYNATKSPKRGTVFLNPGGPGGSGTFLATIAGHIFANLLGPYYDLVGFDPRGIGQTRPKVQCFPDPIFRAMFTANTVFEQGFSVSSNLSNPATRDYLIEQYRQFLSMKETQADLCAEHMSAELRYMGTATVARDIDFMATVLDGEDTLINYWGGSYGTILGAYLANMFPDRVGKVAIDGVANPVLWASKPSHFWHRDWIQSVEDTYRIFLESCSDAGPERCALANYEGEDASVIDQRIEEFLERLYASPLPVPRSRRPGVLTTGGIRALLLIFMEQPTTWPMAAKYLAQAMDGNGLSILNLLLPVYSMLPTPDLSSSVDLSRLAVTCLDSPPPADESDFPTAELLADIGLETIEKVSPHFGVSVSISEPDGGCQFWPVEGPERFTGPWNHTLRNPILIVSNTADPVTPLASGRLVNNLLRNSSRLLVQDSPGHCSLAMPSLCTVKAYRAFFINGTLPPNEYVCEADQRPFPERDVIDDLTADDAELLRSARELGALLSQQKMATLFGHTGALYPADRFEQAKFSV